MVNEENEKEGEENAKAKAEATPTKGDGDKGEETDFVKEAKETAENIKKENNRKETLLNKEEKLIDRREALNALGGGSPAGERPNKPAKLTDREYADKVDKGEVNPLKEDGHTA